MMTNANQWVNLVKFNLDTNFDFESIGFHRDDLLSVSSGIIVP